MCKNVNFNVVEKYKNKDTQEISRYVNTITNKLIKKEFSKIMEETYESCYIL